jgi:hypothetical protein
VEEKPASRFNDPQPDAGGQAPSRRRLVRRARLSRLTCLIGNRSCVLGRLPIAAARRHGKAVERTSKPDRGRAARQPRRSARSHAQDSRPRFRGGESTTQTLGYVTLAWVVDRILGEVTGHQRAAEAFFQTADAEDLLAALCVPRPAAHELEFVAEAFDPAEAFELRRTEPRLILRHICLPPSNWGERPALAGLRGAEIRTHPVPTEGVHTHAVLAKPYGPVIPPYGPVMTVH